MNETERNPMRSPAVLDAVLQKSEAPGRTELAERVFRQQTAMLALMKSGVLSQPVKDVHRELTETTANTLGVARASIWRFSDKESSLVLQDLYDAGTKTHQSGMTLSATDFPAYFEALKWGRVISISDARLDPITLAFKDDYLIPLNIVSLLDAGVWCGGEPYGVICAESVGERRAWTPDEQQFVGSIADLVVIAIENDTRRAAMSELTASEERLTQVFRLSPDLMAITRLSDGVVLELNDSFERQTGFSAAELVGKTTLDIGLWAIPGQRDEWLARGSTDGQVRSMEADLRSKSGEIRTYQISSELIHTGAEPCLISISRDITNAKRQSRMVFEIAQGVDAATGESFFRSLVERLLRALDADMAFVGEIQKGNEAIVQTIAAHGRSGVAQSFSYDLDGSPCEAILSAGVCAYPRDVCKLFPRDQALVEMQIQGYVGAPLIDSSGKPLGLIAALFTRPIEQSDTAVQLLRIFAHRAAAEMERRDQLVELEYRATHDLLTGLYNRSTFEGRVGADISAGHVGAESAFLLVDLDRFKEINDTLGHGVGDQLIIQIASRLRRENSSGCIRGAELSRTGGDEFAVWLPTIPGGESAISIAALLMQAITAPFEVEGYRLEVGASIGGAIYPKDAGDASALLRCAEVAMYEAKRRGSGVGMYDRAFDPYSPQRLVLMGQLGAAVRDGQLEVYYQPRTFLRSGAPAGIEALVRWNHPQLGLLPPSQFIPLAELSDVIRPLTVDVLDQSLAQLAKWNVNGRKLGMGVNLSARNLMDDSCVGVVQRLLAKHAVEPTCLELEITESAIISDPERARITLEQIHRMGVKISIDDFGTGFSSLSHLKRLPLNALKIDVSFVTNMLRDAQDAAIVESTISLAHSLGLTVVAEGIEDEATADRLRELNCEEGQGFHIARPMSRVHCSEWLSRAA